MNNVTLSSSVVKRIFSFKEVGVVIVLIVLCIVLSLVTNTFASGSNLLNIVRQITEISIMAIGMTFVIINAQIDLSVGSLYGFCGMFGAILIKNGLPPSLVLVIMIGAGLFIGMANGLITTKFRIPAFIVTLATMQILRSSAWATTGGLNVSTFPDAALNSWVFDIGGYLFGVIPIQIFIMIGMYIFAGILLAKTPYGFKVYATGGNRNAAKLSGINTDKIIIIAFIINGVCCAVASVIGLTYLQSMPTTAGQGREMDVIAAVILGGTNLYGGRGTILGTLFGAAIMGVVRNGMVLIGVPAFWQMGFIGAIILIAVLTDTAISRRGS
jgi:simple sugar transport system permease protein/ribose transport system permease protein